MRRAASSPFHLLDSHIMNHSPPIVMNAKDHINIPVHRPAIAWVFASSKSREFKRNAIRIPPNAHREPAIASQAMMTQYVK